MSSDRDRITTFSAHLLLDLRSLKTAVVHHWLLGMTGGERVCEAVCELFDRPDLFSLVADPKALSPKLNESRLTDSFISCLPAAIKHYRYYAPLFPLAVESFDLEPYDLVISSDSSVVKGVLTRPETCHICYCHSPMRYAWNMPHTYQRGAGLLTRIASAVLLHYLRLWDYAASARVDYFLANSLTVRERIRKYYRQEARVIYPPCDTDRFAPTGTLDTYYLCVGRLVAYKRTDIAIRAFRSLSSRLLVVGAGPELKKLKAIAPPNVEFIEHVSDEQLADLYSGCRALIFPGEEDLGLVPVEAQACGRPVIGFGRGGLTETVLPGKTGVFFPEQTPESLIDAIRLFERTADSFDPAYIRTWAERFSKDRFLRELAEFVTWALNDHSQRSLDSRRQTSRGRGNPDSLSFRQART